MISTPRTRLHAWLLLAALLFSTTLPRAFVVCVSADDHVSLEAVFEGDPCETQFIFGAHGDASVPAPSCTDIPAIQLSALSGEEPTLVAARPPAPTAFAVLPIDPLVRRVARHDARALPIAGFAPPRLALRSLRTTVLRL